MDSKPASSPGSSDASEPNSPVMGGGLQVRSPKLPSQRRKTLASALIPNVFERAAAVPDAIAGLGELSEAGVAVVVISSELPAIVGVCDRVLVMRHGRVLEQGPVRDVLSSPRHGYTRQLIAAAPRQTQRRRRRTPPPTIPHHHPPISTTHPSVC